MSDNIQRAVTRSPFAVYCGFRRVGAPALRPVANKSKPSDRATLLNQDHGAALSTLIRDILSKHGIPEGNSSNDPHGFHFEIADRQYPHRFYFDDEFADSRIASRLTVYVTAPWTDDSPTVWCKAVKALKTQVDGYLGESEWGYFDMDVEMAAFEPTAERARTGVAEGEEVSDRDWDYVREKVTAILHSFEASKFEWNCVHLSSNKTPARVFIGMSMDCDQMAIDRLLRPAVERFLDSTSLGWSLCIEKHRSWP
ncbi:hypothetical protein NLG97_g8987 [Lecanicillium saksenae]|uniref:Uncharacterized protein n=1 Tax=Lecanicillium saksenae TaxID=468837 RepID=A0ACC1QJZ8_9HYPO|nr:hypothetical protein NLG97_g8987 [Lecanicillium saksenae]